MKVQEKPQVHISYIWRQKLCIKGGKEEGEGGGAGGDGEG